MKQMEEGFDRDRKLRGKRVGGGWEGDGRRVTGERGVGNLKDGDLEQAKDWIFSRSSPVCARMPSESYFI